MPKAIIYCRVSSERQVREGHGLDGQESRCRKYALEKGYDILTVFRDEGISGGVVERDGIQSLLAYLNQHRKSHELVVIIDDIKRLARDLIGHFTLRRAIQSAGARIESPSHRFGEAPEEIFVESIMAATAELERNQNKQQVKNRMQARLEAGYWLFYPPPGYTYANVIGHGKMLVPKEPECHFIREAFVGFANERFATRADVQRFLQEHHFIAREGRSSATIYRELVTRLLTNEAYAGFIAYPPWNVTRRPAKHQPLVDAATFQKVQDRLRATANAKRHHNNSEEFPLRGFVLCAGCQKPYTASWSKGKSREFPYYRCHTKGCPEQNRSILATKLHQEFEALLATLKPRPPIMAFMKAELAKEWDRRQLDVTIVKQEHQRKLDTIEAQIKQYLETVKHTRNLTILGQLEQEIDALEAQKLRLGEPITVKANYDFGKALQLVFDFLENPLQMWQQGRLSNRRLVLRLVFSGPLRYVRKVGFATPFLSQPVAVSCVPELDMLELVDPKGRCWNSWLEVIQQWAELLRDPSSLVKRRKGWRWTKEA